VFFLNKEIDLCWFVIFGGTLIGLILNFTSQFTLSEDVYRYLFDGFLIQHGINPYLYAPNSQEISIITQNFPYLENINNSSVSTPYPPLALFFSFLFVLLFGYNPMIWLLVMNFFTTLVSILLLKLLLYYKLNKNYILLWSLNPNILLEFNHSGHNDVIAIFFLIFCLFIINAKRNSNIILTVSGVLLSISIGFKIFSLIAFPFLIKKLRIGSLIALFSIIIQSLVFIILININYSGIVVFLQYWRFNGGLYELLYFFGNNFSFSAGNTNLEYVIRLVLLLFSFLVIFCLIINFFKGDNQTDTRRYEYIGVSIILYLIFSPVLHPWYTLWPIVFFILSIEKKFYPYWILLFAVNISYMYYLNPNLSLYLIIIEYFIFFLSIIFNIFKKNNSKFNWKGQKFD
jgi:hypothetical protein